MPDIPVFTADAKYAPCSVQDNIFEWHFVIRGPPDTEFEVRLPQRNPCVGKCPHGP